MALDVDKVVCGGFLDKLGVQLLAAGDKGDIHQRAVFRHHGALEQLGAVQEVVKDLGLLLIELLHLFQPADVVFDPIQHQLADINRVAGRGVEHGIVVGVGLVVEHGGGEVLGVADQILTDDYHC